MFFFVVVFRLSLMHAQRIMPTQLPSSLPFMPWPREEWKDDSFFGSLSAATAMSVADMCWMALPKGYACYLWIHMDPETDRVHCRVLDKARRKSEEYSVCCDEELGYGNGTVLVGTLCSRVVASSSSSAQPSAGHKISCMAIHDVLYYKGRNLERFTWEDKCHVLMQLLAREVRQCIYNPSFLLLGMAPCGMVSRAATAAAAPVDHLDPAARCLLEQGAMLDNVFAAIAAFPFAIHRYRFVSRRATSASVAWVCATWPSLPSSTFSSPTTAATSTPPPPTPTPPQPHSNLAAKIGMKRTARDADLDNTSGGWQVPNVKIPVPNVKVSESVGGFGAGSGSGARFWVKATLHDDIYELFERRPSESVDSTLSTNTNMAHSFALIPDYECSVFMNGLFRRIKENANLDALEESDEEDDFEDDRADKYVDLHKTLFMRCEWSARSKKWIPVALG